MPARDNITLLTSSAARRHASMPLLQHNLGVALRRTRRADGVGVDCSLPRGAGTMNVFPRACARVPMYTAATASLVRRSTPLCVLGLRQRSASCCALVRTRTTTPVAGTPAHYIPHAIRRCIKSADRRSSPTCSSASRCFSRQARALIRRMSLAAHRCTRLHVLVTWSLCACSSRQKPTRPPRPPPARHRWRWQHSAEPRAATTHLRMKRCASSCSRRCKRVGAFESRRGAGDLREGGAGAAAWSTAGRRSHGDGRRDVPVIVTRPTGDS